MPHYIPPLTLCKFLELVKSGGVGDKGISKVNVKIPHGTGYATY